MHPAEEDLRAIATYESGEHLHFRKALGLFDSVMMVVGIMIGSGIFIVSGEMSRGGRSPRGWLLVAWCIAGVLTVFGALSYSGRTRRHDANRRRHVTSTSAKHSPRSWASSTAGRSSPSSRPAPSPPSPLPLPASAARCFHSWKKAITSSRPSTSFPATHFRSPPPRLSPSPSSCSSASSTPAASPGARLSRTSSPVR